VTDEIVTGDTFKAQESSAPVEEPFETGMVATCDGIWIDMGGLAQLDFIRTRNCFSLASLLDFISPQPNGSPSCKMTDILV